MKQAAPIASWQIGHADGSSGVRGRTRFKRLRAAYHAPPRLLAEPIAHNHTESALEEDDRPPRAVLVCVLLGRLVEREVVRPLVRTRQTTTGHRLYVERDFDSDWPCLFPAPRTRRTEARRRDRWDSHEGGTESVALLGTFWPAQAEASRPRQRRVSQLLVAELSRRFAEAPMMVTSMRRDLWDDGVLPRRSNEYCAITSYLIAGRLMS